VVVVDQVMMVVAGLDIEDIPDNHVRHSPHYYWYCYWVTILQRSLFGGMDHRDEGILDNHVRCVPHLFHHLCWRRRSRIDQVFVVVVIMDPLDYQ